jgi:hypothetical protein
LDPFIQADHERHVRECFGRCAYSHKTHERMADRYSLNLKIMKWTQIILSALTTAGAVRVVFSKDSLFFPYATLALAVATLIVNSYVKDLNPGQVAQKHRETASDLWNIREAYLSVFSDIRDTSLSLVELRKRRDDLQAQLYKIYRGAPHTDGKAYSEAQVAIKHKEELTFSDAEIDAFLPEPLKRRPSG